MESKTPLDCPKHNQTITRSIQLGLGQLLIDASNGIWRLQNSMMSLSHLSVAYFPDLLFFFFYKAFVMQTKQDVQTRPNLPLDSACTLVMP